MQINYQALKEKQVKNIQKYPSNNVWSFGQSQNVVVKHEHCLTNIVVNADNLLSIERKAKTIFCQAILDSLTSPKSLFDKHYCKYSHTVKYEKDSKNIFVRQGLESIG